MAQAARTSAAIMIAQPPNPNASNTSVVTAMAATPFWTGPEGGPARESIRPLILLQDEGPLVVPPAFAGKTRLGAGLPASVWLANGSARPFSSKGNGKRWSCLRQRSPVRGALEEWKSFGGPAASQPHSGSLEGAHALDMSLAS